MMTFSMADCSRGCAKGLLLILNALCILMALSTFSFAIVDAKILRQYGEMAASGTFAGDVIVIVASLLLIVVASFGCAGAVRDNVKIIYLYVGFLMILVILELLIGIYVAVQRYGLAFRVTDWIREDFFRNVTEVEVDSHRNLWDELQSTYECCGLNGPDDYPAIHQPISLSCCAHAHRARTAFAQKHLYNACVESSSYFSEGCEQELLYALREGGECLLGVAVLCFWFEAAGVLLGMWMANNLKNEVKIYKKTVKY